MGSTPSQRHTSCLAPSILPTQPTRRKKQKSKTTGTSQTVIFSNPSQSKLRVFSALEQKRSSRTWADSSGRDVLGPHLKGGRTKNLTTKYGILPTKMGICPQK